MTNYKTATPTKPVDKTSAELPVRKVSRQEALEYHNHNKPGKIEIRATKPCNTQFDLSLAYTPGVAVPCMEIFENPAEAYRYTAKGNLVAVVTNGTAVLGLGNIGAAAGKPVMEGKAVLFKKFADIDVFDIELNTTDPDEIIRTCQLLEPTFGGINLEDIKAPECFYIEEELKKTMQIPVLHDDQHGTAIISAAALINALELVDKRIEEVRVVFSGAGAAGIACARLYCALGVRQENLLMVDSSGVMYQGRGDEFNHYKAQFVRSTDCRTLADAMKDADVFVGVSKKDLVTKEMIRSMARDPLIFAMANPDPEISYPDAVAARPDAIVATGRSDFPNQVNNVLGFPFIFRGALDVHASAINEEMKIAAVKALAELARQEVPEEVARAYGVERLRFGRDYLIPKPLDQRILVWESAAIAQAAMESGVARRQIDIDEYRHSLGERIGQGRVLLRRIVEKARRNRKTVVFPEGTSARILRSAVAIQAQGIANVIVLGSQESVNQTAEIEDIAIDGVRILDPADSERRLEYARMYYDKRCRKGVTFEAAIEIMNDNTYFALAMLDCGDCDAVLAGITTDYPTTIKPALEIIDLADGASRVSGMFAMIKSNQVYMFADTTVNIEPTADQLAEIAVCSAEVARRLGIEPHIAMLSFSNFGSVRSPQSDKVALATRIIRERAPELVVEGEMQADIALMPEYLIERYPFSQLKERANVFIFPDLNSGNIAHKLVQRLGGADAVGPILMGLSRPVHILHPTQTVNEIVEMAAIAVVDAQRG